MKTIIYALYRNNIPFYVGKSKNPKSRLAEHKQKYGEGITMKELDIIYSVKKEDWKPYETAWIQIYKEWGYEILNKNKGGGGPTFHTNETKIKLSKALTGTKYSDESKAKMSKSHKGKPKSEEHKISMSKSATNRKRSLESKIKQSESLKGIVFSNERSIKIWTTRRFNQQQNANT